MKDKILVTFGTYNSPWFLDTLLESIDHHDAGYPYDLLILDHSSTDKRQLQILDKYSKFYRVETRQNLGRAQGAYNHAYQSNKDYKYYFFLHDDSYILRDNWLRLAVDRINDDSVEDVCTGPGFENFEELPVGKVGFQGYEWQGIRQYLRTNHRTVFYYMSDIAKNLSVEIPLFYQHINDDKILYKNELLNKMERIYNIEHFRQMQDSKEFEFIDNYFESNFPNRTPFKPNEIYGSHYHGFQTTSEFLNDIAPMRYGYRTHIVGGPGYCQEELGWSSFWGNDTIVHWGDHVVFKRLSLLLNCDENEVRNRFKDKTFLKICANIIKKETLHAS